MTIFGGKSAVIPTDFERGTSDPFVLPPLYSILAHPVVSVFCQLSPKQQKYQNFPYKKAVRKWLR